MTYVLVNRKRYARVWNFQPSEHWPLRKWILRCRDKKDLNGWPCFWWMWRLEFAIDSDVYSDDKRVFGWSLMLNTPWAGFRFHWKCPNVDSFMTRETSFERSWDHRKGWAYQEGALMYRQSKKKVWRTWSFMNRLTQVKLVDLR
jgi:hypothetical protein